MRHRVTVKKFNKTSAHKVAMFNNMLTSLFKHEKIETTKEKGRSLKMLADSLIHKAKTDDLHSRRMVGRFVKDKDVLSKLFKDIAPRYKEVSGGYTRKILTYKRYGDSANMCIVMLLEGKSTLASAKSDKK